MRRSRSSGLSRSISALSEPLKPRKHCTGVRFRHLARQGSARGHFENPARRHFEAAWLEKTQLVGVTWLGVTSRPLGSRKLGSGSLFEATLLEKTIRGNYSKKLFELAVTAPWSSASLHSVSSKTRMDILGFTLVYLFNLCQAGLGASDVRGLKNTSKTHKNTCVLPHLRRSGSRTFGVTWTRSGSL